MRDARRPARWRRFKLRQGARRTSGVDDGAAKIGAGVADGFLPVSDLMDPVVRTARLVLRKVAPSDAPFLVQLMNEPDYLRFIGDRDVRTPEQAAAYITTTFTGSYDRRGYGLYLVAANHDEVPLGICGLVKRDALECPDLGFAFLARSRGRGFAAEAAEAVLAHSFAQFRFPRIHAVTTPDNGPSIRLLERLGFRFERAIRLTPEAAELRLHTLDRPAPAG